MNPESTTPHASCEPPGEWPSDPISAKEAAAILGITPPALCWRVNVGWIKRYGKPWKSCFSRSEVESKPKSPLRLQPHPDWVPPRIAARMLGITTTGLTYYVNEGLLTPQVKPKSGKRHPIQQYFLRKQVEELQTAATRPRKEIPFEFNPTATDCAYAAGLIDGEGCVSIHRSHRTSIGRQVYQMEVILTNTDRRMVDWMATRFGGSVIHRKISEKNPRWKDVYWWAVRADEAMHILRLLLPFLVVKREQAELVIQFQERLIEASLNRHRPITDEEMTSREAVVQRLRVLNRRGPAP